MQGLGSLAAAQNGNKIKTVRKQSSEYTVPGTPVEQNLRTGPALGRQLAAAARG